MSGKQAKKLRKEARKIMGNSFESLNKITRARPRWIPKWVWIWFYWPLFPKKYLKLIYRNL